LVVLLQSDSFNGFEKYFIDLIEDSLCKRNESVEKITPNIKSIINKLFLLIMLWISNKTQSFE